MRIAYLCPHISTHLIKPTIMADIKKKIKQHGWTLEKVGLELGATKSTMTKYVSASGNPTLKTWTAIAGVLGISVSERLRDDDSRATELSCPHCGKPIHVKLEKGGSE